MMKKKMFGKVLSAVLIASMVFTSVDVTPVAAESVETSGYELTDLFSEEDLEEEVLENVEEVEYFDADELEGAEEEFVDDFSVEEAEETILTEEGDIASGIETTTCADGSTGELTWRIDANGKLMVRGEGSVGWPSIWWKYREAVISAEIQLTNLTNTANMFDGMENLTSVDLSGLNTDNIKYMSSMFNRCESLTEVVFGDFNTENVIDMHGMFYGCSSLTTLDVSGFKTTNVTDMGWMFYNCKKIVELDVSNFSTTNVTNMSHLFSGCEGLTALDVSNFNTSNVTDMSYLFNGCSSLTILDVSNFSTTNVTNMSHLFSGCKGLTALDVSNLNTANVTDMGAIFSGCSGLTTLDVSDLNTANVTNMGAIFSGCSGLTTLDVSSLNTANVTDMAGMFSGCSGLTTLNLENFITTNVTKMNGMFNSCEQLTTLDLSGFDTRQVTDMGYMFNGCYDLVTLNVSQFVTSNVKNMKWMFFDCVRLTALDVSSFDTSNVMDMQFMFWNCKCLTTLDVSNFDVSKVNDIACLFGSCKNLKTLDLSKFDMENAIYVGDFLTGCSSLTSIKTPLNVSGTIVLPVNSENEYWYLEGEEEISVVELPTEQIESVRLIRKVDATLPRISLNPSSITVEIGEETTLNATLSNIPDGKSEKVKWKSSNEKVVTVSASGNVTAVGAGIAIVTATSEYDSELFATCKVIVNDVASVDVTGVSLTYNGKEIGEDGIDITINDSVVVTAVVAPADATNKKVSFRSSDEKVVTVVGNSDSVEIKGIALGNAVITVTTADGKYEANCKVNVKPISVNRVSISYNNATISENGLTLNKGNKLTLTANVLPANATEKSVSWNSSDEAVATVSANGLVTAVASGNAVITVTTKDGAKSASCNIIVTEGTGKDSASSNSAGGNGGSGEGGSGNGGNDNPSGGNEEDTKETTYKVSVTYDSNGLVSANRTSSVSDGNVSDVVSKNNVSTYDVTVVEGKEVSFIVKPNAEHGVASVKVELPNLKYTLEEVSGNEVASPDGNIKISKADKDGNVTITLKAVSENAVVTVGFKRTTFAVSMNTADGSAFSLQVVDGKVIDTATGKEMTELPVVEQTGLIFTGWATADGTEVTMDNIEEIAMKGTKVSARFEFINLVIKQKQDVTALMNISANTVVKKYATYLVDEKGNIQKDAKGKDMAGTKYLSVSARGIAQAKKDGTVKVVALDASKNEVASCYIRVVKPEVRIAKELPVLSVKTASLNMIEYMSNLPTNSSELLWSLANEKIAKIDAKTGKLTLNGAGSGKVKVIATFTHKDAKTGLETSSKFTTTVTVKLPKMSKTEDKTTTVKVGKAGSIKMTNLVGQKVEWKVEKPGVIEMVEQKDATASSTYKFKGLSTGDTKVIATIDGVTYTFKVSVK